MEGEGSRVVVEDSKLHVNGRAGASVLKRGNAHLSGTEFEGNDDAAEYRAYLSSFPNGLFADIARNRLNHVEDRDSDRDAAVVTPAAGNLGAVTAEAPRPRRIWNRPNTPGDRYRDDDNDDGDDGDDDDDGDD